MLIAELNKIKPGNWSSSDGCCGKLITYYGLPVVMVNNISLVLYNLDGKSTNLKLKIDDGGDIQFATPEQISKMAPQLLQFIPPAATLIDVLNSLSKEQWQINNNGEGINLT